MKNILLRPCTAMVFLILLPLCTSAQDDDDFTADRPGYVNSADILPQGRLQWETAIGFDRTKIGNQTSTTWTLNSSTLRWGIKSQAELYLQADCLYTSENGSHYSGLSDVAVGTKIRLFTPNEHHSALVPAVALLGNVIMPAKSLPSFVGGDNYLPRQWGGQLGLVCQNELSDCCTIYCDGSLTWSDDERPEAFFGASLCCQISDDLFLLAEEYNFNHTGGTESWVGLGAGLMVAPRLQLDISTNISLNYPKRYANLMLGLSWQLTKR